MRCICGRRVRQKFVEHTLYEQRHLCLSHTAWLCIQAARGIGMHSSVVRTCTLTEQGGKAIDQRLGDWNCARARARLGCTVRLRTLAKSSQSDRRPRGVHLRESLGIETHACTHTHAYTLWSRPQLCVRVFDTPTNEPCSSRHCSPSDDDTLPITCL